MNKTLLLIIVDFLFLNLIALTRWERVEPARNVVAAVPSTAVNAPTPDQDLVATMRQQLADEAEARQALELKLAQADTTLSSREQGLGQLRNERAQLQARLSQEAQQAAELQQQAQAAHEESTLTREQLEQLQRELEDRRAEAERQRSELAKLQSAAANAQKQIEGLTMAVVVDEAEKQHLKEQSAQLQSQVQTQQVQLAQAQHSAEQLAQGVDQLAQSSGELTQEFKESQPISANVLYDQFLGNQVQTTFSATRKGLFGNVNRSRDTPTLFVKDGKRVYALLHVADTVFSTDQPNYNWDSLSVTFSRPPSYRSDASELLFLDADPRVVAVPVDAAQVAALGAKVYTLAADPFKFPDAVMIGPKGYGEMPFKLDPAHPGYVRVDNRFFHRLFGDFSPNRGDLVLSQTGQVLGMMVNHDYCVLLKDFTPQLTLHTGPQTEPSGAELDQIAARIQSFPPALQ